MIKKSRKKFSHRFNFALTEQMHTDIHQIALNADGDAAEVVRRMIARETPFFLEYTSTNGTLPNGEGKRAA